MRSVRSRPQILIHLEDLWRWDTYQRNGQKRYPLKKDYEMLDRGTCIVSRKVRAGTAAAYKLDANQPAVTTNGPTYHLEIEQERNPKDP